MNRENEILNKHLIFGEDTYLSSREDVLEAMQELARERAIGFLNFAALEAYPTTDLKWKYKGEIITDAQLYSKYEEHLKK